MYMYVCMYTSNLELRREDQRGPSARTALTGRKAQTFVDDSGGATCLTLLV